MKKFIAKTFFTILAVVLLLGVLWAYITGIFDLKSTQNYNENSYKGKGENTRCIKNQTVKNFDLRINTVSFSNEIASKNYGGSGQCFGICAYEKLVFTSSKIMQDIGDGANKEKNIYDISKTDMKEKQIESIHKLQEKRLSLVKDRYISRYYNSSFDRFKKSFKLMFGGFSLDIDPMHIMQSIDKNIPMVFAFSSGKTGHALLCYKYEVFDNGNYIKFYIKDPNHPITQNSDNNTDLHVKFFKSLKGWEYYYYANDGTMVYMTQNPSSELYLY